MKSNYFRNTEEKEEKIPLFKVIEFYTENEPYVVFPKQSEVKEKTLDQVKGFILRKQIFRPDERAKMAIFEKTLDELINEGEKYNYTFEEENKLKEDISKEYKPHDFKLQEEKENKKEVLFYKQKRDGIYFYTPKEVRNEEKIIREFDGIYLGDKGITKHINELSLMNKKISHPNTNLELIKIYNVIIGRL